MKLSIGVDTSWWEGGRCRVSFDWWMLYRIHIVECNLKKKRWKMVVVEEGSTDKILW